VWCFHWSYSVNTKTVVTYKKQQNCYYPKVTVTTTTKQITFTPKPFIGTSGAFTLALARRLVLGCSTAELRTAQKGFSRNMSFSMDITALYTTNSKTVTEQVFSLP